MVSNQKVEIHHLIDETSKQIYHFNQSYSNIWSYVGIYFSHRNDECDVWGDEWSEFFESLKMQKFDTLARSFGYSDYYDMRYTYDYSSVIEEQLRELEVMFNPAMNKTTNGNIYYSGINWGSAGTTSKKYPPMITISEIKNKILEEISNFEINL